MPQRAGKSCDGLAADGCGDVKSELLYAQVQGLVLTMYSIVLARTSAWCACVPYT